jgi:hypothetical protein
MSYIDCPGCLTKSADLGKRWAEIRSHAAFPRVRTLGRSMGNSAFIFARASSMIHTCELWCNLVAPHADLQALTSLSIALSLDRKGSILARAPISLPCKS